MKLPLSFRDNDICPSHKAQHMAPFKSQQGQSLIQVIISLGILGIVMTGFMSAIFYQNQETRAVSEVLAAMDLQKVLIATFADGSVCKHILNTPSPRTFDSTAIKTNKPQVINVNQIPVSVSAGAPNVAQVGAYASAYSNSLRINSIRLEIVSGAGGSYLGNWIVDFDRSKTVRQVRPVSISTLLDVDSSVPAAAKIKDCQGRGDSDGNSRANNDSDEKEKPLEFDVKTATCRGRCTATATCGKSRKIVTALSLRGPNNVNCSDSVAVSTHGVSGASELFFQGDCQGKTSCSVSTRAMAGFGYSDESVCVRIICL